MYICVPTIATTLITEYVSDERRMFYIIIKIK